MCLKTIFCYFCICHKHFYFRFVLICAWFLQCEKEFHVGCLKEHKMQDLKVMPCSYHTKNQVLIKKMLTWFVQQELPKGKWFCCTGCERIHSALQKLVIRGEEKLPDSSLNFIKKHEESASESGCSDDVRWRLLSKKTDSSDVTEALLSDAVAIFHVSSVLRILLAVHNFARNILLFTLLTFTLHVLLISVEYCLRRSTTPVAVLILYSLKYSCSFCHERIIAIKHQLIFFFWTLGVLWSNNCG